MVFPYSKRVPPKSFVRSRLSKARGFLDRDPQGLRRPRFSFFIFTCQTTRAETRLSHNERFARFSSDDEWQPILIGCSSLIIMRSMTGTEARWPRANAAPRSVAGL